MRPRRPFAVLGLLAALLAAGAPAARAQDSTPGTSVIPGAGQDELDEFGTEVAPPASTPVPDLDDAAPLPGVTPGVPGLGGTEPPAAAGAATPVPPPYLAAGQDAYVQPVGPVTELEAAEVPLEPLRLAAVVAALLAALALAVAALLRTFGIRTAAPASPVAVPPVADAGPRAWLGRGRERATLLADDVRDFLRHSR